MHIPNTPSKRLQPVFKCLRTGSVIASVAEPPLFSAARAPTPEVKGPGADPGSDQTGSAPAPGKKKGSNSGSSSVVEPVQL